MIAPNAGFAPTFPRSSGRTAFALVIAVFCGRSGAARAQQPVWPGYAGNAQHTALSANAAQRLQSVHWHTPIDLLNQNTTGEIFIHYGTPLITAKNTVLVTVRTTAANNFRVEARGGYSGELKWTFATDYTTPPSGWTPSCGSVLNSNNVLYVPGAGGTIWQISNVDTTRPSARQLAFYGLSKYTAARSTYNSTVYVDTPITCDRAGNLYFGFQVTGTNPAGLQGGLARIGANGVGTWVSAAAAANDTNMTKVANNCAPAISNDGKIIYVAVNNGVGNFGGGYLLALDSATLKTVGQVTPKDPSSGSNAIVTDDSTASPTVGPDDDVYFGVLEDRFPNNNDRGWLLHYDKMLATVKTPGSFGWDDSASIVPAPAVPAYTGKSAYLVLTKYNNYIGIHSGDGKNRVGILDPNATMTDPITGATVMNEVITVLGVTPDGGSATAVREWCINTAAIDPQTKSAVINSEDGTLYRWDFTTNTLSEKVVLTPGVGEAYTPTVIGPDGSVYAINDAVLFSVGASAPDVTRAVRIDQYAVRRTSPTTIVRSVKVTNISGCTLTGPLSFVLDNLTANVALANANGTTASAAPPGSPFITVQSGNMLAGTSATLTLTFSVPAGSSTVTYTPRVLSGPGAP